ncbi:ricin B-like lectin [Phanerochaete sordida]|uniref:Ricin B-like lectin n=1 Tax=Phanerochaete sordida TaxID=48140 RepID=A0A9P3GCS4_9APHY|nr:ricin B-like lectin [Phanerochaete sordida]
MASTIQPGIYWIQNIATGTVLDLSNGSPDKNTKVQAWQKRELHDYWVSAQLWIVTSVGENTYVFQNANSRTYAELGGGDNQTPIVANAGTGGKNQQWVVTRNKNGTSYVIQNVQYNTFVDLYNGGNANGTAVNGWQGSGPATENTNQLWNFVRA